MTIPPSAPPVLAEEPAATSLADQRAGALAHYERLANASHCWMSTIPRAINAYFDALDPALLAQARQGREDAERLREAIALLHERLPGMERDAKEFNSPYGMSLTAAIRTVLAATPSPSPEGGNAL